MVNLSNSQMVIICRVELVSPNIERKYLKANKYFKKSQAGNSRIGIMNTNSWGLRQKWSATAASGTRVVYSVPEKGVSGTEYPFRTGKRLFFTPNASENASRTTGGCFAHGTHIPYRSLFLVPNFYHNKDNLCKDKKINSLQGFHLPKSPLALKSMRNTQGFPPDPPLGGTSANTLPPQRSLAYKKRGHLYR